MFKIDNNIQDKTLRIEMELEHQIKEAELYKKATKALEIQLKLLFTKEILLRTCRIKI